MELLSCDSVIPDAPEQEVWPLCPVPETAEDVSAYSEAFNLTAEQHIVALEGVIRRQAFDVKELVDRTANSDLLFADSVRQQELLENKLARSERLKLKYKNASERGAFGNLYNKNKFNKLGKQIIDNDRRPQDPIHPKVVAFADLDRLDLLNAVLGEGVVDTEILEPAAKRMALDSRRSDITGIFGGDEYAKIIQGMTLREVKSYLETLQKDINDITVNPAFTGANTVEVGISIGYAIARPGETYRDALNRAIRAKKYAKEVLGRNAIIDAEDVPKDWVYVRKARAS